VVHVSARGGREVGFRYHSYVLLLIDRLKVLGLLFDTDNADFCGACFDEDQSAECTVDRTVGEPFENEREFVAHYKFTIALENIQCPNYITEVSIAIQFAIV